MVISLFSPYREMHKRSFLWLHRRSQVLFEPHLSFYYLLLCDFPTSQLQPFTGTQTAARQIRICQNQTNFPKYLNWRAVENHGQCCRHPERLASGRMSFFLHKHVRLKVLVVCCCCCSCFDANSLYTSGQTNDPKTK